MADGDDAPTSRQPDDATPGGTPLPPPSPPDALADPSGPVRSPAAQATSSRPHDEPTRSRLVAGLAVGTVALAGLVGGLVFGGTDTERNADPSEMTSPATSAPATDPVTTPAATDPPATNPVTTPAATDPPATAAPTTPAPTEAPASSVAVGSPTPVASGPTTTLAASVALVRSLVPDIAAFPESLDDVAQNTQIAGLASTPRNDVASPGPVGTLCAVVALEERAQLVGRWERNGGAVASTDLSTVDAPGFGDCLVGDAGAPLDEGVYQFVVADPDDNESAAATFVLGAVALEQTFLNDTGEPVCVVRVGPSAGGYYDAYDFTAAPLAPGASVLVALADVDQDVRVDGCDPEADPLAEFDFNPAAGVSRPLDP